MCFIFPFLIIALSLSPSHHMTNIDAKGQKWKVCHHLFIHVISFFLSSFVLIFGASLSRIYAHILFWLRENLQNPEIADLWHEVRIHNEPVWKIRGPGKSFISQTAAWPCDRHCEKHPAGITLFQHKDQLCCCYSTLRPMQCISVLKHQILIINRAILWEFSIIQFKVF